MVVDTVDILHVEHLIGPYLNVSAPVEHSGCIDAQFDCLKPIERLLARLYSLDTGLVETVDVDVDIVLVRYVEPPAFEPFYVDQVSDVLLLLVVVDFIPLIETFNQLLLHSFLSKNIEDLPEFAEVYDLERLPQPQLHRQTLLTHQVVVNLTGLLDFPLVVQSHMGLISLQHQLQVGIVQAQLKGMVEHHEHDQSQRLLRAEVEDGDGGEEVTPVHMPNILEIENFKQPINLLLGVPVQLRKELPESLEPHDRGFAISTLCGGRRVKELLEFVYLDGLPKVFQL
jgi:hypothetical protein